MYYLVYRSYFKSHNRQDFDTLYDMSQFLGIEVSEEDINKGYSIEIDNKHYLLCKD